MAGGKNLIHTVETLYQNNDYVEFDVAAKEYDIPNTNMKVKYRDLDIFKDVPEIEKMLKNEVYKRE